MILGIISDTHGTLSAKALEALEGVDRILHAGDVGGPEILDLLEGIAPVSAVRGNMDAGMWAKSLPTTEIISLNGFQVYLLHNLAALDLDPLVAGMAAVISGHTHQPDITIRDNILYFNPGSASYRRQGGPLSIGRLRIAGGRLDPEIIQLDH